MMKAAKAKEPETSIERARTVMAVIGADLQKLSEERVTALSQMAAAYALLAIAEELEKANRFRLEELAQVKC